MLCGLTVFSAVLGLVSAAPSVPSGPLTGRTLDQYVNAPDTSYKYDVVKLNAYKTHFGGTAHVLNVTSQRWLDTSRGYVDSAGGHTAVWSHVVVVIEPATFKNADFGFAYGTGGCNGKSNDFPGPDDEEIIVADVTTWRAGVWGAVIHQLPNCPYVYPSDPEHKRRTEDNMIAWAWYELIHGKEHNREWLPRYPMVKGVFKSLTAISEFVQSSNLGPRPDKPIGKWMVSGASKRGWTAWAAGTVTCDLTSYPGCPNVVAIAPLVGIVPTLVEDVERQYRSYNGWTFAFSPYTEANITRDLTDPVMQQALLEVSPEGHPERTAQVAKFPLVSSDDEFMQFDWTNIWYDRLMAMGETHLLVVPNSEHSLATGIPEIVETLGNFASSVAEGHTAEQRPSFNYTVDQDKGVLSVTIPDHVEVADVMLRHATSHSTIRRDFRWVRLANNQTGACKFPEINLPKPLFGGNCIVPIDWHQTKLYPKPGTKTYEVKAPEPEAGHWTGYYIEMEFPSDTGLELNYRMSTAGYVYPNTLPFPMCKGNQCLGPLV